MAICRPGVMANLRRFSPSRTCTFCHQSWAAWGSRARVRWRTGHARGRRRRLDSHPAGRQIGRACSDVALAAMGQAGRGLLPRRVWRSRLRVEQSAAVCSVVPLKNATNPSPGYVLQPAPVRASGRRMRIGSAVGVDHRSRAWSAAVKRCTKLCCAIWPGGAGPASPSQPGGFIGR